MTGIKTRGWVNIEAEIKIMITEQEVVQGVVIDPKIKTKLEVGRGVVKIKTMIT